MSADNFLGIYKVNARKYIARGCWSECERNNCATCDSREVFKAKSLNQAVRLAQDIIGTDNYEYGYEFLNL